MTDHSFSLYVCVHRGAADVIPSCRHRCLERNPGDSWHPQDAPARGACCRPGACGHADARFCGSAAAVGKRHAAVRGGGLSYPNADQIQQDKGIKLIKGDGHITLAACDESAQQIRVLTVQGQGGNPQGAYCFKAVARTGYLMLELPHVIALETADHPISADLKPQGDPSVPARTVSEAKNGYQSVGEGTAGGASTVLVELRVTG